MRVPEWPDGAESMVPVPADGCDPESLFAQVPAQRLTIFELPAGQLRTESLTPSLAAAGRRPLWLRVVPDDADPGGIVFSLARAAGRYRPGCGDETLALMRTRPGPVYGWPTLFDRLAGELSDALADDGALVLEHAHRLRGPGPTLALLGSRLLPVLRRRGLPSIIFTCHDLGAPAVLTDAVRHTVRDLAAAPITTWRRAERWRGRPMALAAVRAARATLGSEFAASLDTSTSLDDLLTRVARALTATLDHAQQRRLGLAVELEYGRGDPAGPWWQQLEHGWCRLRTAWRAPLSAALGPTALPDPPELRHAADRLAQAGAVERAVSLYLAAREEDAAAAAMAAHAATLMDLGRWDTLDRWAAGLPADILAGHPQLIHYRGEIAAVRGDLPAAQRWFDLAVTRFSARTDHRGACRSLMAASSVAAAAADLDTARVRSAAAITFAEDGTDPDCLMWSAWQQATTALLSGDTDAALLSFERAARAMPSESPSDVVRSAVALSRQVHDLRRRQESHRGAQQRLHRRESDTLTRLLAAVSPATGPSGLADAGWSAAPVPLRLRGLDLSAAGPAGTAGGLGPRLRRLLTGRRSELATPRGPEALAPAPSRSTVAELPGPALIVELLGPFRVAVDDVALQDQLGARVRSLLAYLVTHRNPWPSRESTAEALWPGTTQEAGRNSLHVAVHGLRRALREVTATPVVDLSGPAYMLNPAVALWVDVEAFDEWLARARGFERSADTEAAIAAYENAISLYRGDFLAEDLYEEWPGALRERLRLHHLDALDRLARLHFDAGGYARAADLSRQLIDRDPCREDAHRLLMRCHSRQGQAHLALLQFRTCARTLGSELRVEPSPETIGLYRRIRRHETV